MSKFTVTAQVTMIVNVVMEIDADHEHHAQRLAARHYGSALNLLDVSGDALRGFTDEREKDEPRVHFIRVGSEEEGEADIDVEDAPLTIGEQQTCENTGWDN